jgi:hypothetical protein
MKRNTKICLGTIAVAVIVGFGGHLFFKLEGRKFIQDKTGLQWPAGTSSIRTFECPGPRSHWTKAFLILPKDSLDEILRNGFTSYEPDLPNTPNNKKLREQFLTQAEIFNQDRQPALFFSAEKLGTNQFSLGRHIYYKTGDRTGINRFIIVADSSNGNTWIHVFYPD